ncbi:MAG: hypothetical protein RLZZ74_3604 [Cyanobacteriota bacterium]|jgi:hypothetical protein
MQKCFDKLLCLNLSDLRDLMIYLAEIISISYVFPNNSTLLKVSLNIAISTFQTMIRG